MIGFEGKQMISGTIGSKTIKHITISGERVFPVTAGTKPSSLTPSGTYNGSAITNGYTTPAHVTMVGSNSGTNAGTYTAAYTPDTGYCWSDETTDTVTVTLTIGRASVGAKPGTSITRNYTGSAQNNGYTTPTGVTMTGSNTGTNGGTYSATYTPDSNHKWSNNTTSAVTRVMTIQYVWNKYNAVAGYKYSNTSVTNLADSNTYIIYPAKSVLNPPTYGDGIRNLVDQYQSIIGTGTYIREYHADNLKSTYPYLYRKDYENCVFYVTSTSQSGSTWYITGTKKQIVSTYYKGSTSYGTVANTTNSSAYPSNGRHTDGYWYVKTW